MPHTPPSEQELDTLETDLTALRAIRVEMAQAVSETVAGFAQSVTDAHNLICEQRDTILRFVAEVRRLRSLLGQAGDHELFRMWYDAEGFIRTRCAVTVQQEIETRFRGPEHMAGVRDVLTLFQIHVDKILRRVGQVLPFRAGN